MCARAAGSPPYAQLERHLHDTYASTSLPFLRTMIFFFKFFFHFLFMEIIFYKFFHEYNNNFF